MCEMNELQSINVEHLFPHHDGKDRDRMYDWNNLFYSCAHCNNIKKSKVYDDVILDCCKVDPERYVCQELVDNHVRVSPKVDTIEAERTAQLLTECFEHRNTGIRVQECAVRVRALQATMNVLYKELEKYKRKKTNKGLRTLRGLLDRSYKFSGFTRTYVRLHLEEYPDLADYVSYAKED